jgi:hypothetical protein
MRKPPVNAALDVMELSPLSKFDGELIDGLQFCSYVHWTLNLKTFVSGIFGYFGVTNWPLDQ